MAGHPSSDLRKLAELMETLEDEVDAIRNIQMGTMGSKPV